MSLSINTIRWLCVAILLWLGARVVTGGMADLLTKSDPEQALAWRTNAPEAVLSMAAAYRQAGDLASAAVMARRALAANPLDGRGYHELALITQAEGNLAQAEILMQQAVRRAPRDLGIRDWLLRDALIEGRTGAALDQIDVMLRVDPGAGKDLYPAVALAVNDPQALSALAQMLAKDPPWRAAFWGQLCASGVSVDSIETLVNQLASSPKPLQDNERSAWLERLIVDRRWSQAFPLWVETLPVERRGQISNIHDGGFESPAQNSGFGWRFGYVAGAKIERIGPPGASYLHIGFGDRRVPFDHVRQLLALSPGAYRMQGRVRSDGLRSERGLQWVVTCAAGATQRIGESERFSGTIAWRDFSTDVVVPQRGCGAQWLRLQIAARIPAERQVDGAIDFTDLRIDRVAGVQPVSN